MLSLVFSIVSVAFIETDNLLVTVTFLVNFSIAIAGLMSSYRSTSISLWMIYWFFNLVFFCLVPYIQYVLDRWEYFVNHETILSANLLIFIYMVIYALVYFLSHKVEASSNKPDINGNPANCISAQPICINRYGMLLLVAASVVFMEFTISMVEFDIRQSLVGDMIGDWGAKRLIGQFFLQPAIFFVFYLSFAYALFNRTSFLIKVAIFVSFIPAVILNIPVASSRFYVFVMYLPVILLALHFVLKIKKTGSIFILLMPLMLITSAIVSAIQRYIVDYSHHFTSYIFSGHFDAYENLVHMLDFASEEGFFYGHQLLGGIFFWIPRSDWPEKPVGTGSYLAQNYLLSGIENISSPLIGEFYMNFSVFGVLGIAIVLGWFSARLDKKYSRSIAVAYSHVIGHINGGQSMKDYTTVTLYPIIIAISLFFYRGDIITAMSSLCGILLAYFMVKFILFGKIKFA